MPHCSSHSQQLQRRLSQLSSGRNQSCHQKNHMETQVGAATLTQLPHTHTLHTCSLGPIPGSEDVPVINWKPPKHRNIPIKAIATTARSPPEGEEDDEQGYRQVNTLPRSSARRLRPPAKGGVVSPSSMQYRQRNASAERPNPRQAGSTSLRSRSPSPSGQVRVSSRSPSPTTIYHASSSSPQMRQSSPKSYRKPHPQGPPSPTSGLHALQSPGNRQKLIKSPSSPSSRKVNPPSPGGSPGGRGRGVPLSASAPSGQRRLAFPGPRHPGPGATSLTTPPSANRPQRQQLNATESSPREGPRTQISPQKTTNGGLMKSGSPHSTPGSKIKAAKHSAASPSTRLVLPSSHHHSAAINVFSLCRPKHQSGKPPQQVQPEEEDWLEGCF